MIVFQAKLNNFPHSFHKSIEIFRLRVAASQRRHGSNVVVVFISFDNNCEFSLSFHVLILARHEEPPYWTLTQRSGEDYGGTGVSPVQAGGDARLSIYKSR